MAPVTSRLSKWWTVCSIAGAVVLLDASTKGWIQEAFRPGESVPVVGDAVRFTYVLNPGVAFGFHVGAYSRPVFTALAVVALVVIGFLLRATPHHQRGRLAALAMVAGGALGNLLDRVLGPGGVVDFMDVGLGAVRWPVFNVADVGVTVGAVLLVAFLWEEGPAPRAPGDEAADTDGPPRSDPAAS